MISFDFLEDDSEKIEFIESIGQIIKDGNISPESLNEALGNFFSIQRYLITLYESVNLEFEMLKLEYDTWYAECFQQSKIKLNEGITAKSKFASTTEIQNDVIVSNKHEYNEYQQRLILADRRRSFYFRIMESWKSNSQQIIQLAQNARTELFSLNVEKKANEDITKEKLIRHVPTEQYDDFEDDENEVCAEPTETPTIKKVKKVVKE